MHRPAKQGLGAAYVAGFSWGLERDYQILVEMDADGSHAPEQLPRLLTALKGADLVLGSRGHDDVGAFGDEPRCDGTTDASGAGGDDRETALQESRCHLSAPAEMPRSKDFWNAR